MRNISANELKKLIDGHIKLSIVDVRDAEECRAGHIEGAVCLPMNRLEDAKNLFDTKTPLVVYCSDVNCNASLYAADRFQELGFREVYELGGGLEEWKKETRIMEAPRTAGSFQADIGEI